MLYPKNKEKSLDNNLFKNPSSEYRGAPFWAWNCKLDKEELLWQIEQLKEMGFGGFHMHSRQGMSTTYLSKEFSDLVRACTDKAEKEGMRSYLYDEDKWPSGFAGGFVTQNRRYSTRQLLFTVTPREYCKDIDEAKNEGKCYLLGVYDVILNDKGELKKYKKINENDDAEGTKWYAYTTIQGTSPWFNNQTYVDTLSKEAIDKFIELTYNFFEKAVGNKFGDVVPSIFTDEPQYAFKHALSYAMSKEDITFPWTIEYDNKFIEKYSYSILDKLPELFWELPNGEISVPRYNYHDFTTELFATCYADNCGNWCKEHNLLLTGHVLAEETLASQSDAVGEAMRSYRNFGIPGIDMLCNWREYTTAKQAQSVVHQYGKEGMTTELYGVTNWDFDFRGHKFQGDWQAALGATVRVPHLSWVSMKGSAKRDYPATINYQSPWYKEYKYIEDHFSRLNTALTRGTPTVKVAVIHPIETYWLHYGPNENTSTVRKMLNKQFSDVANWLLSGLMDFDYISESLLPDIFKSADKTLKVGEMEYSAIVISGCETLRGTTVKILTDFVNAGGKVIIAGNSPYMIDATPSYSLNSLIEKSKKVQFSKSALLEALEEERLIDIREKNGSQTDKLIYQMRKDNDCSWLFIALMEEESECKNLPIPKNRKIIIKGEYTPLKYDTLTGNIEKIDFEINNGYTVIPYTFYRQDSLLLQLNNATSTSYKAEKNKKTLISTERIFKKVKYDLSEPNVLLLDIAEHKTDDEKEYQPLDHTRRIEYYSKNKLSLVNTGVQPWVIEDKPITHSVTLRYTFESEIELNDALLATEDAETCKIIFNGERTDNTICGYFTDKSINTIKLPPIKIGTNILEITYPLGDRTNIEDCFILGNFNVKYAGIQKTIVSQEKEIAFGDVTSQGLPFYGANITYSTKINAPEDCDAIINIGTYSGTAMRVYVDDKDMGILAYAPYEITVKDLKKGEHELKVTLYGNRYNSFGSIHLNDTKLEWFGPNAWDFNYTNTIDNSCPCEYTWKYEYNLKPFGILASPIIKYIK